jgi:hypothetical protein
LLQLAEGDQLRTGDVALLIFPRLADVQQEGRRLGRKALAELADIDAGNRSHREILVAGAQASPVT